MPGSSLEKPLARPRKSVQNAAECGVNIMEIGIAISATPRCVGINPLSLILSDTDTLKLVLTFLFLIRLSPDGPLTTLRGNLQWYLLPKPAIAIPKTALANVYQMQPHVIVTGSGLLDHSHFYTPIERERSSSGLTIFDYWLGDIIILEARKTESGASSRNKIDEFIKRRKVSCEYNLITTFDVCMTSKFAGGDVSHVKANEGKEAGAKTRVKGAAAAWSGLPGYANQQDTQNFYHQTLYREVHSCPHSTPSPISKE
ncbi:hypothetical protein PAAG_08819 [Paracoccidioides lutzii Pb01]|uniref:Uncharacterized protein n=1 Tax=Paracoccidioides lutzii (strain ATCC MYA-826 / Pb01) TaxID=502779 RepID=C1HDH8_PARBA|nr:hypothetical protein PAAG_08819 [Paracoccidioides lutzii Pb01]EEH39550.2 hypothetical protein PAAG_08819 [Paracoccidioides lutzii Pb01]